jgi:hypothetical protein
VANASYVPNIVLCPDIECEDEMGKFENLFSSKLALYMAMLSIFISYDNAYRPDEGEP